MGGEKSSGLWIGLAVGAIVLTAAPSFAKVEDLSPYYLPIWLCVIAVVPLAIGAACWRWPDLEWRALNQLPGAWRGLGTGIDMKPPSRWTVRALALVVAALLIGAPWIPFGQATKKSEADELGKLKTAVEKLTDEIRQRKPGAVITSVAPSDFGAIVQSLGSLAEAVREAQFPADERKALVAALTGVEKTIKNSGTDRATVQLEGTEPLSRSIADLGRLVGDWQTNLEVSCKEGPCRDLLVTLKTIRESLENERGTSLAELSGKVAVHSEATVTLARAIVQLAERDRHAGIPTVGTSCAYGVVDREHAWIHFDVDKDTLAPGARESINGLAEAYGREDRLWIVVGFADTTGSSDKNDRLSVQRAKTVEALLKKLLPSKPSAQVLPLHVGDRWLPVVSGDNVSAPVNRSALILMLRHCTPVPGPAGVKEAAN